MKLQKLYGLISVKMVKIPVTLSRETLKKTHLLECLEQLRTGQTGHVKIPSFSQKKCSFFKLFFSWNEKEIVQIQTGLGLFSILFYLEPKQVFVLTM